MCFITKAISSANILPAELEGTGSAERGTMKNWRFKRIKIGQVFKVKGKPAGTDGTNIWDEKKMRRFRVIGIYPFMILAEDIGTGLKRCFCWGECIQNGWIMQEPEKEVLKREKAGGRPGNNAG